MNESTTAEAHALRSRLASRLRRVLRGDVRFESFSRARYATDASRWQADPVGIVVPADEADVIATLALARELGVPVVARGAGTSLDGRGSGAALVIDHSRHLDRVTAFDREAMTVQVQPGIVLERLNAWLAPHDLWFPIDVPTSAQATIGGMAGNDSWGPGVLAHGSMARHVQAIDAILPDGTTEQFGPFGVDARRPMGSARTAALVSRLFEIGARERDEIARRWPPLPCLPGAYNLDVFRPHPERPYTADGSVNLAHLLVGSRGTLAHFRRLTLKLSPLPARRATVVAGFATAGHAIEAARQVVGSGPTAVVLVACPLLESAPDAAALRAAIVSLRTGGDGRVPQVALLVGCCAGVGGATALPVRVGELLAGFGATSAPVCLRDRDGESALRAAHAAAARAARGGVVAGVRVAGVGEHAVPLVQLDRYVAGLAGLCERRGAQVFWHAHASAGTLRIRPLVELAPFATKDEASGVRALAVEAEAVVRDCGGTVAWGDGAAWTGDATGRDSDEYLARQFGPRLVRAFAQVRESFDPDRLMHPATGVGGVRRDAGAAPGGREGVVSSSVDPVLAASAPAMAAAVAACDGCGDCRKLAAGTMCPSFRATRDERDSTRGRANTLRQALAGRLGADALESEAMHDTLALCIGCKACRSECHAGVDMARLKIGFLHRYHRTHARRWREQLVAFLPRYAPWLARVPWLANLRNRIPGAARLGERLLGWSARRPLPTWRRDVFTSDDAPGAGNGPVPPHDPAREVVLWADTFDNYFEPDNLRAARRVLQAAGYRVHVARAAGRGARPLCCGRTFLDTGMVEEARIEARRTLEALTPWLERGVAVVGLEPSCLLTMRDEFGALGLDGAVAGLASRAMLFEEFLASEHAAGRLRLPLHELPQRRALVHGHCHQKAFGAFAPVHTVLGLVPGLEVETTGAGCCGMGGSFGFEAEHDELSMRIGEQALLPAVRAAGADVVVVADGCSCRAQIAHGAGRRAEHVARVIGRALAAGPAQRGVTPGA